ncbi:MAG: hypothetical protein C4521_12415 [Actinobacteria bacterium]|nr:MAG: hypothetical protein C4521_12415 [Actinomycetota bacterium]
MSSDDRFKLKDPTCQEMMERLFPVDPHESVVRTAAFSRAAARSVVERLRAAHRWADLVRQTNGYPDEFYAVLADYDKAVGRNE